MSKRQSKTGVQHLVYQAKTGFQFYFTFPSYFAAVPQLPAQIRWSLGHDEALARDLANHLNPGLQKLLKRFDASSLGLAPELFLSDLNYLHAEIRRFTEGHQKIWALRPSPALLANSDRNAGYERLMQECQEHPVLFCSEPGGEIHFALFPSEALKKSLKFGFTRFDWPLGTHDPVAANAAAAYIYSAITVLETTPMAKSIFKAGHPLITMLSFYEYLCFARPDQGRNLLHIPPGLPQSAHSVMYHLSRVSEQIDRLEFCTHFQIVQEESGLYVIRIPLRSPRLGYEPKRPEELRIELLTCSPILASLLVQFGLPQIDRVMLKSFIEAPSADACERAMQEIQDLIRRMLGPIPPAEPMDSLPELHAANSTITTPQDAGTLALLNALGSVLPPSHQAKLQALFETPASNDHLIQPMQNGATTLHFGALTREFEERQVREGAWGNPRTRITMHARLEGLAELIGGHRRLDTLARGDFNALRDQLRSYPKNRHRLRATRHQPLSQIIQGGKYEPINARTAKKFFELARALISYAHDQGYLKENLAAGLSFSTKGAPSPRKRTYSPRQIEQLLNGPVYTLKKPPRWRLDDYRFWLPALGLYSGARLSELCQLRLGDIFEELGVWVISISSSAARQLKTADSERLVPLHKVILEAGFLDFHQMRLTATGGDLSAALFEKIHMYGDLSPGHVASRWFLGSDKEDRGYLGQCGLGEDELTFHGLRHTFINQFRRQKLDLLIGKALVGHADRSTTGGYGDCYPSYVLKAELDKIDYEASVEHIHYNHYQQLQAQQGVFRIGRPVGGGKIIHSTGIEKRHWRSYVKK
ncbi:site-specific integrase [Pseudomonas sp. URMO17WK12:I4]|uniref:site-specific integrase n=1 Tax=Pseudomonas sp. URMO17WK12:I4 TaxID=1283292 RepID=UPI000485644E|nr:site-specific integrase [Pseudomonas sp. URMO17WK12:I4]